MKIYKTFKLVGEICLVFMLTAVYLLASPAETLAEPTGELRIGVPTLITETFHPLWATSSRKFYYEPMYDFLIGINAEGKLDPKESIAYKWEETPDHLSWTFWIRDGVTFHDGTPLTLDDVKHSLTTQIHGKKSIFGKRFKKFIDRVEIVTPDKVVINLKQPWPVLLYRLCPYSEGTGVILPKKYLEKVSADYYESHPVGTGPYKFLEKKEGDYIKYIAQDNHWRVGTPKYKYLTFKMMPEMGTREAALQAGEADIIKASITSANKLSDLGFPVYEQKGAIDLNLDFLRTFEPNNPLHKKKVRQALVYAIDKASILKHILQGRGNLIGHCYQMFSSSISYKEYPVTPYDPEKAKKLLGEAGYPNGFTIYLYSFITSVLEQKLVNEAIAGFWEAIGMDVKIIELDFGAFVPIWMKRKDPPGPASHIHSWSSRPLDTWRGLYGEPDQWNWSQTNDPVLLKLITDYENATTIEEFIAMDRACEERVLEEFYKSGIASSTILWAVSKKVPKWDLGRGTNSYRFEYVGARK